MIEPAAPLAMNAVLYPHRSLAPRGFIVLMCAVALVSFTAGIVFAVHGAWPVFGFFGLDVLALYIAFRLSYRAGRLLETVQISAGEVRLARVQPNGKRQDWSFAPYWLQVVEEQPDGRSGWLLLRSHGRSVRFAEFLSPPERTALANEMRNTLRRLREAQNPSTSFMS
ncbi:MAG: DUF2244 domain-containing protein [Alphaproteobacteria bacterium]